MGNTLTLRPGINVDWTIDLYTDPTNTTRIDFDGWTFVLSLACVDAPDMRWSTTDDDPALAIVSATDPTGSRLSFHLSAVESATITSNGALSVLRVDPEDASNVELVSGPTAVSLAAAP